MDTLIEQIQNEVMTCLSQVSAVSLSQVGRQIDAADRIFVAGIGRSGLCMRALAMRLMHLGKTAFVVGETTTPSITADNLLVLGSGSGSTPSLLSIAEQARRVGATILLFTTDGASPMADLADHIVVIPAPSINRVAASTIQPMGSLFEQCLLILCDTLIAGLMQHLRVDAVQMRQRHANLE